MAHSFEKCEKYQKYDTRMWAVVLAHLRERSLLILEVCGSNPVIGKNL